MLIRHSDRRRWVLLAALGVACAALAAASAARAADGDISTAVGGGGGGPAQVDLRHPRRVAFLPGGDLLVVEFGSAQYGPGLPYGDGRIRRVTPGGDVSTFAGTGVAGFSGDGQAATSAQFNGPTDAVVTSAGDVLIADEYNHRVRRVGPDGVVTTVAGDGVDRCAPQSGLAGSAQFSLPRSLALAPGGGYYVLDECGIAYLLSPGEDGITGSPDDVVTTVAGADAEGFSGDGGPAVDAIFNEPRGIAVTASGDVLIADSINRRIRRVRAGTITTVAGPGAINSVGDGGLATAAYLAIPRDVEAVPSGGFLIADSGIDVGGTWVNSTVRRVLPGGTITTIAGTGPFGSSGDGGPAVEATLAEPFGVNLSPAGDLYISGAGLANTPSANQRVRVVEGALNSIPEPPPPNPDPTPTPIPTPTPPSELDGPGIPPGHGAASSTTPATIVPSVPLAAPPAVRALRPLRVGLILRSALRGYAPRTVSLRLGADRAVTARRVVVQIGKRVRVHRRILVRYRDATATILRGRSGAVRLRLATPGTYLVRLRYLEGGRTRTTAPITLVARPRHR